MLSGTESPVVIGNRVPAGVFTLRVVIIAATMLFFLVGVPLLNSGGVIPDYRVQQLGRFLCFALVALGADLLWGYTGLLSLCQAMFFCIGGYTIAMHLSLPDGGGIYDVPQFLTYVYYGHADPLPPFWKLFKSGTFAIFAGVILAGLVGTALGFFIFRSRIRGVYFSIITQAIAWGAWLLISQHEMLMGGTNGLTNFSKSFSEERGWVVKLYLATVVAVILGYLLCRAVTKSRAGRVMVAVRDKEMRLYFAGYQPYAYKVFAFAAAGIVGAVGGMLYPPQMGIITPQNMNVQASIEVAILVAVGGRGKLWGAIFGAVLVKVFMSALSSDMAVLWPYFYGGIFIAVVLFFPQGFVGLWDTVEDSMRGRAPALKGVAAGLAIATCAVFSLAEVLGLMPSKLETPLVLSIPFGKAMLISLGVAGLLLWALYFVRDTDMSELTWTVVAIAGGTISLVAIGAVFYFTRESFVFDYKWKYVVLVLVLVKAAILLLRAGRVRRAASSSIDAIPTATVAKTTAH